MGVQRVTQCLGEVTLVVTELALQGLHQVRPRLAIIPVTRSESTRQDCVSVIDDQGEFDAIKPAHRGLALGPAPLKTLWRGIRL